MKYYEKRKHLISKIVLLAIVLAAVFFAICDCTPQQKTEEVTITYERS